MWKFVWRLARYHVSVQLSPTPVGRSMNCLFSVIAPSVPPPPTEHSRSVQVSTLTLSQQGIACVNASSRILDAVASSSGATLAPALDSLDIRPTTALVADVLDSLRYDVKFAFQFFTWAGHYNGYVHNVAAYNLMIDILSSTRYKSRQFGVVCDVLDYMKRHDKPSVPLDALLSILKLYAEKHFMRVVKPAKKRRIKIKSTPEVDALNLLLDGFCKCCLVREAHSIFSCVKKKLLPNAETYNVLFFGWCRVRDPKKAIEVLEEMIQMGHKPENFTYNAAIESFSGAGMVKEAMELFDFMRTEGSTVSSPTAKTYSTMIVALAKDGMMDECYNLLEDMRTCGCLPDVSTYQDLIEGMCLAGKVQAAYKVLEEMGKTGFPPDILTFNSFLKVLCRLKLPEEALQLCERIIEACCEPSVHTYNMLIALFFNIGEPDRAFSVWHEMEARGCDRTVETYEVMIEGLIDTGRMADASLLLEQVIGCDMKLSFKKFDSIILRLSTVGNLRLIHQLSDHMRKFYNVAMSRRFAMTQKKKSMGIKRR